MTVPVLAMLGLAAATGAAMPTGSTAGETIVLTAAHRSGNIVVDGQLDESLWSSTAPVTGFRQAEPNEGAEPSERTEVIVLFDDEALYVGARLHDTAPEQIVSRLARRDREVNAERFTVFIDPHRDRRSGVYFGLNAAGTQYDGTLFNDHSKDDSWDGVWAGKVSRNPQGWTAELRIPLSQLRWKDQIRPLWGMNFERVIARKNERDLLVFTPRRDTGFVSRFPALEGLGDLPAPARMEFMPYASVRLDRVNPAASPPGARPGSWDTAPRAGADVKVGIGSNLTLDGAVYPDFGQVEVDPAVVNLSDQEVFFSEKRPFFIESSDLFTDFGRGGSRGYWVFNWPGSDLFYSRRIGRAPQGALPKHERAVAPQAADILGAAKLTGKLGSWNIGTMHAFTQQEQATTWTADVPATTLVEPFSYYSATRVQREIDGGRHGVGLITTLTARQLDDQVLRDQFDSNALVTGVDGWTSLDQARGWILSGWSGVSRVAGTPERMRALQRSSVHYFQRPDADHLGVDDNATSLGGYAGRLSLDKQRGQIKFNTAVGMLSPGWEVNSLGFGTISDLINAHVGTGYRWTDPGRVFRRVDLTTVAFSSWDYGRNNTGRGLWTGLSTQFLNFWSAQVQAVAAPQRLSARQTRGGPLMLQPAGAELEAGFDSDDRKSWQIGATVSLERTRRSSFWRNGVGGYLELRPLDRLTFKLAPSYTHRKTLAQYLETIEDPTATATYGSAYLFGQLDQRTVSGDVRMNWTFTPTLSLELFAQTLVSSVDYARVWQLAAPSSYDLAPTDRDPAAYAFSLASFRASVVLRWEYLPGSTVFVVWNPNQSVREDISRFDLGRSLDTLGNHQGNQVVMVKASYWWNL